MKESPIPIRNVYYILAYAWDFIDQKFANTFGLEKFDKVENLLAKLILFYAEKFVKNGFYKTYQEEENNVSRLNGQILIHTSISDLSIKKNKMWVIQDDFNANNIYNQIIYTTLANLLFFPDVDSKLKENISITLNHYFGVSNIVIQSKTFSRLSFHGNNRSYKIPIKLCELLFNSSNMNQQNKNFLLDGFFDEKNMSALYEAFLFNFLRINFKQFKVQRQVQIRWNDSKVLEKNHSSIPLLKADIIITSPQTKKTLIIDAKYYKEMMKIDSRFQYNQKEKVHSNHLQQIYSYLDNLESNTEKRGLLIYPMVTKNTFISDVPLNKKNNYLTSLCTLNLNDNWNSIHESLMSTINSLFKD